MGVQVGPPNLFYMTKEEYNKQQRELTNKYLRSQNKGIGFEKRTIEIGEAPIIQQPKPSIIHWGYIINSAVVGALLLAGVIYFDKASPAPVIYNQVNPEVVQKAVDSFMARALQAQQRQAQIAAAQKKVEIEANEGTTNKSNGAASKPATAGAAKEVQ